MTLEPKPSGDSSIQTTTGSAPQPDVKPNLPSRGPLLRRRIRIGLGLSLLGVSGWLLLSWVFSPSVWNITSSQAVVNARIMALHSPIEGTIATPPPSIGKAVEAGAVLV